MNKVIVKYYSDDDMGLIDEVFESVVAHQIGGGAVQIVLHDGVQRIINNFSSVDVLPSEEDRAKALERTAQAYGDAVGAADVGEAEEEKTPSDDKVTPIK